MSRLSKEPSFLNIASTSQEGIGEETSSLSSGRTLRVTLLSSEWKSTKGGVSTINRELAIQLAKHPDVEVSVYLPECSEEDKRVAASHNVRLIEAEKVHGIDPDLWLSSLPAHHAVNCVIGHGVQLGKQVQLIKRHHDCKWIQVVHTDPEELGMFKTDTEAISKGEENHELEVKLCELSDQVVAVGPKLAEAFSGYLRPFQKDQNVLNLTPGIFSEFADVKQASEERKTFSVLLLGNGDSKDLQLKGYDIAARAVAELKDMSEPYKLKVVGIPSGREQQVREMLLQQGISHDQLVVRGFKERERLAEQFCEVDLAIMPSRSEGFGLPALEALSAGLPVLVSGNSGLGEALKNVPFGSFCVLDSNDPKRWAEAIRSVRQKRRNVRLVEMKSIREEYVKVYSWNEQCRLLVQRMMNITSVFSGESQSSVAGSSQPPFPSASQTHLRTGIEGFSVASQSSVAGYSQLPFPPASQTHLRSGTEGFSFGSQSSVAGYSQLPFPAASQTFPRSGTEGFSGGSQSSLAGYSQLPFPAASQTHWRSGIQGYTPAQLGSHPLAVDCNPLGFPANTQAHQRSGSDGSFRKETAANKRSSPSAAQTSKRLGPFTPVSRGRLVEAVAESESGISDLMEDMDTGYEQDFDVEIIDGFYHQNIAFMNDKVRSFAEYWMQIYSDCCLQRDDAMKLLNDKPEDAKVILRSFPTTEGAPNIPQLLFETEETKRKKRKPSAAEVESDGLSLVREMKDNFIRGRMLHFDVPNVFPEGEVSLIDYEKHLKQCHDSFRTIDNYVVKNAFLYGKWLSQAFNKFQEEKAKQRVSGNFDDWVNSRCKVKQTRARQLRKFYKQLSNGDTIRKYFEEHREVKTSH